MYILNFIKIKNPKIKSLKNMQAIAGFEFLIMFRIGKWKPKNGIFIALMSAKAKNSNSKITPDKSVELYAKFKILASILLYFNIAYTRAKAPDKIKAVKEFKVKYEFAAFFARRGEKLKIKTYEQSAKNNNAAENTQKSWVERTVKNADSKNKTKE